MKRFLLKIGNRIQSIKGNKLFVLISLGNTIILLILTYFLNNMPLFTGENLNEHAWIQLLKEKLGQADQEDYKDVLFINVAYDKQLVDKFDKDDMYIGNIDITDRTKLLDILSILDSLDRHRYIFLDVRFEKGFASNVDSALFAKILRMDKIVIANHSDIDLSDSSLLRKAAMSDYYSTIVATNFTKYKYLENGQQSMPLYAYKELTGKTISKHGPIYTSNSKLCQNSLFLSYSTKVFSEYDENKFKNYYNLGSDILENDPVSTLSELSKGKYVFIGDMVNDMHDTYAGLKPGPLIIYKAFHSLMDGKHFVSFLLYIFLAIVFFLISLSLFRKDSLLERIPFIRDSHSDLLHFIISFIGYAFVLFMTVILLHLCFGITVSFIIPSFYFAVQKTIIKYKRKQL